MLLSIDPGSNGGAALFMDSGELQAVHRLKKTKGSRFFTSHDLSVFKNLSTLANTVVIEEPFWHKPAKQSMVHHGTTIATWGQLLGALQNVDSELITVTSKEWKGRMDLSSRKTASLDLAREYFPDFADQLKYAACDGVAEAMLIGVYYGQRYLGWNTYP